MNTHCSVDFLESDSQLIFYRFYVEVKQFGDLPVFETILLDKFEDEPAFRRQLVDSLIDAQHNLPGDKNVFRRQVDLEIWKLHLIEVYKIPFFVFTEVRAADVTRGNVQVQLQILYFCEPGALFPGLNKNIFHNLLSHLRRMDDGHGQLEKRFTEMFEQRFKRGGVVLRNPGGNIAKVGGHAYLQYTANKKTSSYKFGTIIITI